MPKRCFQNLLLRPVVRRQSARISARLSSITSGRQLLAGMADLADNATMQTEPSKAEPPKRKRRWFQFSLRSLLIVALFCAVASNWAGMYLKQKWTKQEAANLIVSEGGYVLYDYGSKGSPWGPSWLRKLLGENFFDEVTEVCLSNPSPDAMERVGQLSEVRFLHLFGAKVTDGELACLSNLKNLELLELIQTSVTGSGLDQLEGLTNLTRLDLDGNCVTDSGLKRIKAQTQLKSLFIDEVDVTGAGVGVIQEALPNCWISFCNGVRR